MKLGLLAIVLVGCSKPAPAPAPAPAEPEAPAANPLKEDVEMVCATKFGSARPENDRDTPVWQVLEPKVKSPELKEIVVKLKHGEITILDLGGWLEEQMPKVGVTSCESLAGMKPAKPQE